MEKYLYLEEEAKAIEEGFVFSIAYPLLAAAVQDKVPLVVPGEWSVDFRDGFAKIEFILDNTGKKKGEHNSQKFQPSGEMFKHGFSIINELEKKKDIIFKKFDVSILLLLTNEENNKLLILDQDWDGTIPPINLRTFYEIGVTFDENLNSYLTVKREVFNGEMDKEKLNMRERVFDYVVSKILYEYMVERILKNNEEGKKMMKFLLGDERMIYVTDKSAAGVPVAMALCSHYLKQKYGEKNEIFVFLNSFDFGSVYKNDNLTLHNFDLVNNTIKSYPILKPWTTPKNHAIMRVEFTVDLKNFQYSFEEDIMKSAQYYRQYKRFIILEIPQLFNKSLALRRLEKGILQDALKPYPPQLVKEIKEKVSEWWDVIFE